MASLAPLLETIRLDLGLSFTALGLLTTIPVFCLAAFPVAANHLARRIGIERALVLALALITLATAVRLAGEHVAVMFASVLVVGIGVAAGQTYVPAIAKHHFGTNAAVVTALYASTMSASAVFVVATTPALTARLGSWPEGLAIWSLLALAGVLIWLLIAHRASSASGEQRSPPRLPWRSALAWRITSFSTVTFLLFFVVLAWYAPIYQALGRSEDEAAALTATLLLGQLVSALAVTAMTRTANRTALMALGTAATAICLLGVAVAPLGAPVIWAVLGGLGLGVQFTVALTLPVDFGRTPSEVGQLTAMAMTVGYFFAAIGPAAMGGLRDLTGSFTLPVALLAVLVVVLTLPALKLPQPVAPAPTSGA